MVHFTWLQIGGFILVSLAVIWAIVWAIGRIAKAVPQRSPSLVTRAGSEGFSSGSWSFLGFSPSHRFSVSGAIALR